MHGINCIGVLTSGGDAPGMNAAIRAVTRTALYNGFEVRAIYHGFKGLVEGEIVPFRSENVSNIIQLGGTILKTARSQAFMTYEGRCRAYDNMQKEGIDALVPVPLHPDKLRRRGYNQSEWIARGVARATGITLHTDWLEHTRDTRSQTRKGVYDRWLDTHTAYDAPGAPDLDGHHLLLIDDVVTTGATLLACAQALHAHGAPRISCLVLAATQP